MDITKVIICPGCGWAGSESGLKEGSCPICEYENGSPPYRLLTLSEMLIEDELEYVDVRMDLFLSAVFRHLFPDKKFGKDDPKPVRSNGARCQNIIKQLGRQKQGDRLHQKEI